MIEHAVAAYTFSKSYSMSGWRIGFAVAHPTVVEAIGKLINTTASCSPPFVQWAAQAALEHDAADPRRLHGAVPPQGRAAQRRAWRRIDGIRVVRPAGTFYVFPDVRDRSATAWASPRTAWRSTCSKGPTTASASPAWAASASATPARGFLRFSCAEPDERIDQAVAFLPLALDRPIASAAIWTPIPSSSCTNPTLCLEAIGIGSSQMLEGFHAETQRGDRKGARESGLSDLDPPHPTFWYREFFLLCAIHRRSG